VEYRTLKTVSGGMSFNENKFLRCVCVCPRYVSLFLGIISGNVDIVLASRELSETYLPSSSFCHSTSDISAELVEAGRLE
jgi:hypothetical protein